MGLGAAIGLVAHQGVGTVAAAFAAAGWGVALVVCWRLVPMVADTVAWACLFERPHRPSFLRLLWARWIGDAVNKLLPALQIGGEVVKTRLLMFHSVPGRVAGASVVVDLTIGVLTLIVFSVVGVTLILRLDGTSDVAKAAMSSVGVGIVALAGFYLVQRRGLFGMLVRAVSRFASGRDWMTQVGGARSLDAAISALYRRRRALLANGFWQFLAWLLGTGEVWLALHFMDYPVSLLDALLVESLIQLVRASSFVIPGALGVQEGGLIVLCGAVPSI